MSRLDRFNELLEVFSTECAKLNIYVEQIGLDSESYDVLGDELIYLTGHTPESRESLYFNSFSHRIKLFGVTEDKDASKT